MFIKNKKIRNIFISLFVILNIFFFYAKAYAFDVKISDIKIVEQTGSITVEEPKIENNEITSNITFNEINDFVTFELDIKNNDKENYTIENIINNNKNKNITITTEYDSNKIEKENINKIRIKIQYENQLVNVEEVTIKDLMFTINLKGEDGTINQIIINNPKTGDSILKYLILLIIALTGLIFKRKEKKLGKVLLILPIILLPFTIFANEKYEEKIKFTDIKIKGIMLPYEITLDLDNGSEPEVRIRKYGEKLGSLPNAVKEGYEFNGWYDKNNNEVNENTIVKGEIDLKAKYSIILYSINYNLDGGSANNPSIYTVEDEITLNNPTKTGYEFNGWTGSNGDNPQLNVTIEKGSIGSKEYTANYSEKEDTPYKVIHKLMDLNGETYTVEDTEEFTGKTNSKVTPNTKTYEGFTSPMEVEITIKADGTTELEYLYTRNKYTLNITDRSNLDEEKSASNGEYYYGEEITLTALPKAGYDFKWSDNSTSLENKITVEGNITITPIYTPRTGTPYKVIHKKQDLEGNYTIIEELNLTGETDKEITPTVNIYEGFISPNAKTIIIKADGTTVLEYLYERRKYTFTLEDTNNIDLENSTPSGTYYYDTEITIKALDKPGYTYTGWDNGETNKEISFKLTDNTSIKPLYEPNTNTPYKVIHKLMNLDGSTYTIKDTDDLTGETDSTVTPNTKTYEGFTAPERQTVTIKGDGSLEVEYLYTRNKYNLTLEDTNYIEEDKSGEYYYDTEITIKVIDRDGYTFTGWSNGVTDKEYTFKLTDNISIKPVYSSNTDTPYKVIHKRQDLEGNYTLTEEELLTGETDSTVTPNTKTYEGFTAPERQTVTIKGDGSLEVEYLYTRNKYNLTLEDTNYIEEDKSGEYYYDTEITIKVIDRDGYTFTGWSNGVTDKEYTFNLLNNISLTPIYDANTYEIVFNSNSGTGEMSNQTLTYDTEEKLTKNIFTKQGYTFTNWNTKADNSGESYDDEDTVKNLATSGTFNLYAQYSANTNTPYKVIHKKQDLEGNYTIIEEEPLTGTTDTQVIPSTKTYDGFTSPSTNTLTIKADGTSELTYLYTRNKYTITFDSNGGSTVSSIEKYYEEEIGTLPIPTRAGYIYLGWYTELTGGTEITSTEKITSNITIHAQYLKSETMLKTGPEVNSIIKTLANDDTTSRPPVSYVTAVKRSNVKPDISSMTEDNIISVSDSNVPVYMWFDEGIIYWYTIAEKIYLNPNSKELFGNLYKMTEIDLTDFDTSKVTTMQGMFVGANSLTSIDLSNFNTSNVTNMSSMFAGFANIDLDLSNFDTSSVTTMEYMFASAILKDIDLRGLDISNVENMHNMFAGSSIENINMSGLSSNKLTNANLMFAGGIPLKTLNMDGFNFSNLSMESLFDQLTKLESISLKNVNTSGVTNMKALFRQCSSLNSVDLSSFDVSSVTDVSFMFQWDTKLENVNLSTWNTSKVENFSSFFQFCDGIKRLDLSNFNTSSATNISWMFMGCSNLEYLDISNFDFGSNNLTSFFQQVPKLSEIKMDNVNTSNVTNMSAMFNNCTSLEILDLTSFDTSKVENMGAMFLNTTNLKTIYVSDKFVTNSLTNTATSIFVNTTSLVGGAGTIFDSSNNAASRAIVDEGESNPGYFTNHYYIEFNSNDGTGEMSNQGIPIGKSAVLNSNTFTKEGYALKEWNTKADGTGTKYSNNATISNLSNTRNEIITLYAQWVKAETILNYGTNVNMKMKKLTGATNYYYSNDNSYITSIKFSTTKPDLSSMTNDNIISTDDANVPVYIWFDNGTIYLYTEAKKIYLNQDSSCLFLGLTDLTEVEINKFDTSLVTNMSNMFNNTYSLTSLDLSTFNTSNVTNMSAMFNNSAGLESINLSTFDTSNVTDMSYMFSSCRSLESINLSTFNTSNVTNMNNMFAFCVSLSNLDLSIFNTNKVTNMSQMFLSCVNLESLNLSTFNTSNVTDMSAMFSNCNKLVTINVSNNFKTTVVNNSTNMFYNTTSLVGGSGTVYNSSKIDKEYAIIDEGESNPGYFTNHYYIVFNSNGGSGTMSNQGIGVGKSALLKTNTFTKEGYSFKEWNTKADGSGTTYSENANISLDLQKDENLKIYAQWNMLEADLITGKNFNIKLKKLAGNNSVNSYYYEDHNILSLIKSSTRPDITSLTEDNLISIENSIPVYAWYKNNIIYIWSEASKIYMNQDSSNMFKFFENATDIDVTFFDTSKVENMEAMFDDCRELLEINLSKFNTSNVTNMKYMFANCLKLKSIDASKFNTSNVTNMSAMFFSCDELETIDISSFDTNKVTDMSSMFNYSKKLKTIYVSNYFVIDSLSNSYSMFSGCNSLIGGLGTAYNSNNVSPSYAHIDGGTSNPGYFTYKSYSGTSASVSKFTNIMNNIKNGKMILSIIVIVLSILGTIYILIRRKKKTN